MTGQRETEERAEAPSTPGNGEGGAPARPMTEDEADELRRDQRSGDETPWQGDVTPSGEDEDTPERPA